MKSKYPGASNSVEFYPLKSEKEFPSLHWCKTKF